MGKSLITLSIAGAALVAAFAVSAVEIKPEKCIATDGDTIRCGDQPIRIIGLDTPEIFTPNQCRTPQETARVLRLGYGAKGRLQRYLDERATRVVREGFDKYGRIVAHVFVGNDNVADLLIRDGYARPYECKNFRCPRRLTWCQD